MRVSLVLPVEDWRACGPAARAAEEDGFDAVTANELRHDPFAPLAFAALATERVQLATSVAIAFPRSPMIVANQAWDLRAPFARGRFVLGLGSQVKAHNERRFSVPWIAPAARMGEYVASAARDLPLLGAGGEARLSRQILQFHPDDAGILAPSSWACRCRRSRWPRSGR